MTLLGVCAWLLGLLAGLVVLAGLALFAAGWYWQRRDAADTRRVRELRRRRDF